MIGPAARVLGFAVSSSSASATSRMRSSRSSRFSPLLRGDLGELRLAAPLLRLEPVLGQLRHHPGRVRVGHVDLVDRDDDRHLGRARVGDRLARLRHDAVVGGDDEHGDVGDLRAAGAHGRERLVARRVDERDPAAGVLDLVGADVLRDPAGLGGDDVRLADAVEERRLAVVDVAHDGDDRRPRQEILLGVLELLEDLFLVGGVLDRDLAVELGADQVDLLVRQRLRRRLHLPHAHQDLDDLRQRDAERLREVADADAGLDADRAGRRRPGRALDAALGPVGRLAAIPGTAARSAAALDDDAALPARARRALAGPDGPVGTIRISHQRQCRAARAPDRRRLALRSVRAKARRSRARSKHINLGHV